MEPTVKVLYSESTIPDLKTGSAMSLGVANSLFEIRDVECAECNRIESVTYEIKYMADDGVRTCCCVQSLGNGEGSVINHIRNLTIENMNAFKAFNVRNDVMFKNPFDILRSSCENMLSCVLPELEAYCLAYKAVDIISSYEVDNCHLKLHGDVESIMLLIKNSPKDFIQMFEETILKNPQNTSLIVAIENLIYKTERYVEFLSSRHDNSEGLTQILQEATRKATMINSKSILYGVEPPYIPTYEAYEH